ncbi:MAG: hypothetical protein AAGH38_02190 [Pseudomonadota bacterium]
MCGPVPAALAATGLQTFSTLSRGRIASKQAKADAQEAARRASEAEADTKRDLAELKRRQNAELARRRVAFAKSGVRLAGSPIAALGKVRSEFDEEAGDIRRRGSRAARGLRNDSSSAKRRGTSGRVGTVSNVGTSLLRDPNIIRE